MASTQDTNSDSRTNSLTNTTNSQNDDDFSHMELKGWLMKRSKMSRTWKKQWFLLKNTDLCYGDKPEHTPKKIPLSDADISESTVDRKMYAFRIKLRDKGRSYYIHAENEAMQNDWMQAICFAKAAGRHGDNSQACVIQ